MKAIEILKLIVSKITMEVKVIIILISAKIPPAHSYLLIHGKMNLRLKIILVVMHSLHAPDGMKFKRSLL